MLPNHKFIEILNINMFCLLIVVKRLKKVEVVQNKTLFY